MISLITAPFKVNEIHCRSIEWIIEEYFGYCQYEWDDGYVRDYEGNNPTYFKGYKEYIINHSDEDYFDFSTRVSLRSLICSEDTFDEIDKNKITVDGLNYYVPLPYIFSLLTKQDISFYEIDIATYQGRKTTILSTGNIVTVNLQLSELDAVT